MITILLIFSAITPNYNIFVPQINSSSMKLNVCFLDSSAQPITRFVISNTPPVTQYQVIESSILSNTVNTPVKTNSPVHIGNALRINDCVMYPITIYPLISKNKDIIALKELEIDVKSISSINDFEISRAMAQVLENLVLNFPNNYQTEPGSYLIIAPDAFLSETTPLAIWKEKKGWHVTLVPLSQTGSSATEIKNYIANFYQTTSPLLEYVLVIGDANQVPAASQTLPVSYSDYAYTLIDNDDFLAEILIGRLPASNTTELSTMIAKTIGYEQDPYVTETQWFTRALMVAAHYPAFMTTPIPTKRWVRDRFYEYGFNEIDTVYYPPVTGATEITNSINQGVVFVNYRGGDADPHGWNHPDFHNTDVTGLANGSKLPVITSIVCLNGNFGNPSCFGKAWLTAGNPINPKGGVAFFGAAAATTSSRWNNCLDFGIYYGLLKENIYEFGAASYRGKMEVFCNFPLDTTWQQGSSFYFHTYNLLGDPSLDIWTGIPDTFVVSHDASVPVGTNSLSIMVENSTSQPVENALVSLYKENEVKAVRYTDQSGFADFDFTTSTTGSLYVTVTKHNHKPYCGHCLLNNTAVYVGYKDHAINDPGGNNNGEINPGESIELSITLQNYGTSTTAQNVSAKLTTADPLITITDSLESYGNIAPGATANASPFDFQVSTSVKNLYTIEFTLEINSNQGSWTSTVWPVAYAPEIEYQWYDVLDGGNHILEPGETSNLITSLANIGGLNGNSISGILRSWNSGIQVTDSIGNFGNIPQGDSSANNSNPFQVQAAQSIAPGHEVGLSIILSGNNGFSDTVMFKLIIGVIDQTVPLGPDDYGYYAYDDTDTDYSEHPQYNWIEIDPELGGAGDSISLENDETKTLTLPFSFKYYGNWYDRISICSNGYVAMDSTWIADMYNWHICAAGGPPLLIAPFWDDLDPNATDSSGHVCYWYDAADNYFVIEYSRVQHLHDPTNPTPAELQTFEIILYDPQHYPTQTGDGEILFQYKDITNDDIWHNYATVGIEDYDHFIGLEHTYANIYPEAAAPLANNRAIKFTTDQPDTFPGISENGSQTGDELILTMHPNPFSRLIHINLGKMQTAESIELKIFDTAGRLVKSFDLGNLSKSVSSVCWHGDDNHGNSLPQGIYFVSCKIKNKTIIKKIVLLK